MDEAVIEEAQPRAMATEKRKAWAQSRDSWQASEAEDVSTETMQISQAVQGKLQLEVPGNIPNEKIRTWLKDCRTPLGASLDEQKGILLKNGGSFEDDLSLGAEANHLNQRNLPMEPSFNGLLAKDRRFQFHQKGRSMNSTGSGKSSTTVSSVSELLDLYEEDPEEILYNLGFGRDEPDIASKIPPRFFNNSSFAHGIDIKVFLNAQMQRMEIENPNYALTSRFRQIKVLTDVANAFSSLYSQVSGTPLQKIGLSKSLSTSSEAPKPAPLNRASSQTAVRLMETLSKLNLCGSRGETNATTPPPDDKEKSFKDISAQDDKAELKMQKPFKKNSPPLATVKEETSNSSLTLDLTPLDVGSDLKAENTSNLSEKLAEPCITQQDMPDHNTECDTSTVDMSDSKDCLSLDLESEISVGETNPDTSTPEKESYAQNKSLNLVTQPKESFELEELQSSEEEPSHVPSVSRLTLEKIGKDNLLRTASQHSDSSGFAEDTSGDCLLMNSAQLQESLQAMGSSADSCDSENTVISESPRATDLLESSDIENEEFLTPRDLAACKIFFGESDLNMASLKSELPQKSQLVEEGKSSEDLNSSPEINLDNEDSESHRDCTADSEMEIGSEFEVIPYTTHHISESMDCFSDYDDDLPNLSNSDSLERVNVALQRAQMKVLSSEASGRAGRSMITSKDLLKRRHKYANSGYPLRRTQSLPSALLSPVRVVSKVNIVVSSGKTTVCSPPSFSYKYTPEELGSIEEPDEDGNTNSKSALSNSPRSESRDVHKSDVNRVPEGANHRPQSCSIHAPSHRSQSSCSLHSLQSDWHERPLCEHARTWSTHSIPNFSGASCGSLVSPFACPLSHRFTYGPVHRSCSGCTLPMSSPPSTTEMQLRRVLHDIRSALQNFSQNPVVRGNDAVSGSYNSQRSSILPLYENTFQELQIMRRSLNLFRTQMMDLELNMLRQQTMVYQHLTEDERYEADQLQVLRNSVRMELQDLELQLDDRLLTLEEQLRNVQVSSPFQRPSSMGMYGGRSTDNLMYASPLNVIEPVTELIREQTHLKSELGLEDLGEETGAERCESFSQAASDSSSVSSSPFNKNRRGFINSDPNDKAISQTPPSKTVFRASVALTPSAPVRPGVSPFINQDSPEASEKCKEESPERTEPVPSTSKTEQSPRWTAEENKELQQVIREIKESIVGDIRREIVSGLLAAVSSPLRSSDEKTDGRI
ncbi:sperm-specific antigen 2 isoform X1 [Pelobates cultripes]|uniref:Sperm-specific antigen 2 isoform X1 n=2 Tax=Pelobates cultripes TaxID=61616 RepID=A0AAD1SMA9_PELCU|nr:sperm-specific antigen 2 isoform X1 [Pelobates cultripes]